MKKVITYMITIKFEDGSEEEIIVYEPYEIGQRFRGGEIIACHSLKRTFDLD